jgi:hypothetical protein
MDIQHKQREGLENNTINQSQPEATPKENDTVRGTRQKRSRQAGFVIRAVLIGVIGTTSAAMGAPLALVIPTMLEQSFELIMEAAKESESKPPSDE